MNQLTLRMISCLPYGSENFLLHSGVRHVVQSTLEIASLHRYSLVWITAGARCGKTHLAIQLSDCLVSRNLFPVLLEGKDFAGFLETRGSIGPFSPDEVFLIDDSQRYFNNLKFGDSGPLVAFLELARAHGNSVIFLSSNNVAALGCDEHALSRLRCGHMLSVLSPADGEMAEMIKMMAKQRGILLTDKRSRFVAKRLKRDIAAIEEYLARVMQLSDKLHRAVKLPLLSDAL